MKNRPNENGVVGIECPEIKCTENGGGYCKRIVCSKGNEKMYRHEGKTGCYEGILHVATIEGKIEKFSGHKDWCVSVDGNVSGCDGCGQFGTNTFVNKLEDAIPAIKRLAREAVEWHHFHERGERFKIKLTVAGKSIFMLDDTVTVEKYLEVTTCACGHLMSLHKDGKCIARDCKCKRFRNSKKNI